MSVHRKMLLPNYASVAALEHENEHEGLSEAQGCCLSPATSHYPAPQWILEQQDYVLHRAQVLQNLSRLLAIIKALNGSDSEAANEALRCVANALLLIEEGRTTWIQVQGSDCCLDLLEVCPSLINHVLHQIDI